MNQSDHIAKLEQHIAALTDENANLRSKLKELDKKYQQVEQVRQQWTATLDAVSDPIFVHDEQCRIIRANTAYAKCAGLPVQDIIGKPYWQVFPKADGPLAFCAKALKKGKAEEKEEEIMLPTGEVYIFHSYALRSGDSVHSIHIMEDVTERKQAETELVWTNKANTALAMLAAALLSTKPRSIEDVSSIVLDYARELTDSEFGYAGYIDPGTGHLTSPTLTLNVWDQCQIADKSIVFKKWGGLFGWVLDHKKPLLTNNPSADPRSTGTPAGHVPIERFLSVPAFVGKKLVGQIALANPPHDYTKQDLAITKHLADLYAIAIQRWRTERELVESEEKFRTVTTSAQDGIIMMDDGGKITYWNKAAEKIFGYTKEEAIGKPMHELIAPEKFHADSKKGVAGFLETGKGAVIGKVLELPSIRKGGEEFYAEHSISGVKVKGEWHAIGLVRDVTERKQAELKLQRTNRALRTLSATNAILVHAKDEEELLQGICQAAVQRDSYSMVWVGYAEYDAKKTVRPVAQAGFEEGYLEHINISWANTRLGKGPMGTAIRTGKVTITGNIQHDPRFKPWREEALRRGYASSVALPLIVDDEILGALNIYASEPDAFDEEEIKLLAEMADDLAYGIIALRTKAERDQHEQSLRKSQASLRASLTGTIDAVARAVGARDPYTAGHQKRVAELSVAIAGELGWEKERIEGLRLGAMIHDIGKINIPAEMLSKPVRLTEIEYQMMMTHPETGYEILKDIAFPWPVADIAHQHHERLDGSGYPQGLKADQIIDEAKIVAVADVVEAMSSHRPYRPGLGVNAALEEISKNRGKAYDADVVDACKKIFTEKNFSF
jgi:PAS domain S-box-containing protein/putative nucleotidyltransferase with HDIG domain